MRVRVTTYPDEIQDFRLRVIWRAAELGLTLERLAGRAAQRLPSLLELLDAEAVTSERLDRLSVALEWPPWSQDRRPWHAKLPDLDGQALKVFRSLTRKKR